MWSSMWRVGSPPSGPSRNYRAGLDREIAINLKTAVLVSQAAIEALTRTRGCIVNFSSIAYFNPQAPWQCTRGPRRRSLGLPGAWRWS